MFKIMKEEAPNYLMNLIPKCNQTTRTRNSHIPIFHCQTDCFKYSFFPSTLRDWFNLDDNLRNSDQSRFSKTGYYCLFDLYKSALIFLTQKD